MLGLGNRKNKASLGRSIEEMHALAEDIAHNRCGESIRITLHDKVDDVFFEKLGSALQQNTSTKYLTLDSKKLSLEAVEHIATGLKKNTYLEKISFRCCRINDQGAQFLADALTQNHHLQTLSLEWNKIGDVGAIAIANALKVNRGLRSLILRKNAIGDAGGIALAEALRINSVLSLFSAWENNMGDKTAIAMAEAMGENHAMTDLSLDINGLNGTNWSVFEAPIIGKHKNLLYFGAMGGGHTNALREYIQTNKERARYLLNFMTDRPKALRNASEGAEAIERLPAIYQLAEEPDIPNIQRFLDLLPTIDMNAPNIQEALFKKEGSIAPIDNPQLWQNIGKTLQQLNARGWRIQKDLLLDKDGQPSILLNRAVQYGKAAAFFTEANWQGASKQDIRAVLQQVPQTQHPANEKALLVRMGQRQSQNNVSR